MKSKKLDTRVYSRIKALKIYLPVNNIEVARQTLIEALIGDLPSLKKDAPLTYLIELAEATLGDHPVIRTRKKRTKPKKVSTSPRSIDLTRDKKIIKPLEKVFADNDQVDLIPIKTGLALKHVVKTHKTLVVKGIIKQLQVDYPTNIMNFLELRMLGGELTGNVYFNLVRSEESYDLLNIDKDVEWYRSYAKIRKVTLKELISYLSKDNIEYLVSLNKRVNKNRRKNTDGFLGGA